MLMVATLNMLRNIPSANNEKKKTFKSIEISEFFKEKNKKKIPSKTEVRLLLNNWLKI